MIYDKIMEQDKYLHIDCSIKIKINIIQKFRARLGMKNFYIYRAILNYYTRKTFFKYYYN